MSEVRMTAYALGLMAAAWIALLSRHGAALPTLALVLGSTALLIAAWAIDRGYEGGTAWAYVALIATAVTVTGAALR